MPSPTNPPSAVAERTRSGQPADRSGVLLGTCCYLIWGLFPLFWPLLVPAGAVEVLAHRLVWTLVVMLVVAAVLGRWRTLRRLPARGWAMVAAAAVLITVNWGVYIYAVNSGHVVESALGYFINPLVSIVLGVVVLRERLRRPQLVALAIATVAVLVLAVDYGRIPVIALSLAASFGLYGLIKKTVPLDPASSLTAESVVIGPLALAYLVWLGTTGAGTFTTEGTGHVLLLICTGPITAVPLLLFGAAAKRIPLVTLGMLQYLTPVLQFAVGVFVNHEPMPVSRWLGFGLVWTALVVFTASNYTRRTSKDTTAEAATAVSSSEPPRSR